MPNQENSPDGKPHVDKDRPSPDVEGYATDGQSNARGKGVSDQQGERPLTNTERPPEHRAQAGGAGGGPALARPTADRWRAPEAPSQFNDGDRGAADPSPALPEQIDFEDFSEESPRGDHRRTGGTWDAPPHNSGDQGDIGRSPGAGLSDRNGPSDPDAKKGGPME